MWHKINYHIAKLLQGILRPRMIYYSKNFQNQRVLNLRIGTTTFIDAPSQLKLANNIYIGHFNFIEASNGINIEEGCQITSYVSITTHSSHNTIRLYGSNYGNKEQQVGYLKGSISIGKFTFVGPHTTIMPNTVIGEGCIISAYAYVKGTFPPFSVISGNPAKVVGSVKNLDENYLRKHPELSQYYMQ